MNRDMLRRFAAMSRQQLDGDEPQVVVSLKPVPGLELVVAQTADGGRTVKAICQDAPHDAEDLAVIADAFGLTGDPLISQRQGVNGVSKRRQWVYQATWAWREALR